MRKEIEMFGKQTVKCFVFVLCFACALIANPKLVSAQTDAPLPANWYCDERWRNKDFIYVGTVAEIIPLQSAKLPERFSEKSFLHGGVEYLIENVIRFDVEKVYRGKQDEREIIIYNARTTNVPAIDFKPGEKYLVYLKSHGYGESLGKGTFSRRLNYITPDGRAKPVSESAAAIAFLEKVYRLDSTREILDYKGKDFITGGILGGKATMLVKPAYPKAAKKGKASGAINVMILIGEQGNVIKARAVCAGHPSLAKAAEAAALLSKFSPTLIKGKPIKVKGVIVYNFFP